MASWVAPARSSSWPPGRRAVRRVDAALQGSRQKFVQALLLDGAMNSLADAERMADDLLKAQAEYLPQFGG